MRGESQNHSVWNEPEMSNYSLDFNALNDIIDKLKNFNINKKIIISRLEKISNQLSLDIDFSQRLGPVLPLPLSKYDIDFDKIMILLWPKFKIIFDMNLMSIIDCDVQKLLNFHSQSLFHCF